MVTFTCDGCNTTLKKNKVASHRGPCARSFSCVDCGEHFTHLTHVQHTECVSEDQKYQKSLFQPKKTEKPALKPAVARRIKLKKSIRMAVKAERQKEKGVPVGLIVEKVWDIVKDNGFWSKEAFDQQIQGKIERTKFIERIGDRLFHRSKRLQQKEARRRKQQQKK
jgi:hypothetical protein